MHLAIDESVDLRVVPYPTDLGHDRFRQKRAAELLVFLQERCIVVKRSSR